MRVGGRRFQFADGPLDPVIKDTRPVGEAEAASEFPFVNDLADSAGLDAIIAEATALESAPARKVIGRETSCLKAGGDLAFVVALVAAVFIWLRHEEAEGLREDARLARARAAARRSGA